MDEPHGTKKIWLASFPLSLLLGRFAKIMVSRNVGKIHITVKNGRLSRLVWRRVLNSITKMSSTCHYSFKEMTQTGIGTRPDKSEKIVIEAESVQSPRYVETLVNYHMWCLRHSPTWAIWWWFSLFLSLGGQILAEVCLLSRHTMTRREAKSQIDTPFFTRGDSCSEFRFWTSFPA